MNKVFDAQSTSSKYFFRTNRIRHLNLFLTRKQSTPLPPQVKVTYSIGLNASIVLRDKPRSVDKPREGNKTVRMRRVNHRSTCWCNYLGKVPGKLFCLHFCETNPGQWKNPGREVNRTVRMRRVNHRSTCSSCNNLGEVPGKLWIL